MLVLGGARSGKSAFAENAASACGLTPVYLATAQALDAEMAARIASHRLRRGGAWLTIEEPLALSETLARESHPSRVILVDCLTLWLTNLLLANRDPTAERTQLVKTLCETAGPIVLVSNEVGQGVVPVDPLSRRFVDEAGRLHQALAEAMPAVAIIVAGLPIWLKREGKSNKETKSCTS